MKTSKAIRTASSSTDLLDKSQKAVENVGVHWPCFNVATAAEVYSCNFTKKDYLSVKLGQKKETPSSVIKLVIIINIGEFIY